MALTATRPGDDTGPSRPIPPEMARRIQHLMATRNDRDVDLARSIASEWGIPWRH